MFPGQNARVPGPQPSQAPAATALRNLCQAKFKQQMIDRSALEAPLPPQNTFPRDDADVTRGRYLVRQGQPPTAALHRIRPTSVALERYLTPPQRRAPDEKVEVRTLVRLLDRARKHHAVTTFELGLGEYQLGAAPLEFRVVYYQV